MHADFQVHRDLKAMVSLALDEDIRKICVEESGGLSNPNSLIDHVMRSIRKSEFSQNNQTNEHMDGLESGRIISKYLHQWRHPYCNRLI